MTPQSLNVKGSAQPEIFKGTVDAMVQELRNDPDRFWKESVARNGPIEIWDINGVRILYNGNHRYQAAILAGVEIPASAILIVTGVVANLPIFPLDQLDWLPGVK